MIFLLEFLFLVWLVTRFFWFISEHLLTRIIKWLNLRYIWDRWLILALVETDGLLSLQSLFHLLLVLIINLYILWFLTFLRVNWVGLWRIRTVEALLHWHPLVKDYFFAFGLLFCLGLFGSKLECPLVARRGGTLTSESCLGASSYIGGCIELRINLLRLLIWIVVWFQPAFGGDTRCYGASLHHLLSLARVVITLSLRTMTILWGANSTIITHQEVT